MELEKTYEVGLSREEVLQRLSTAIDPQQGFLWDTGSKPYVGRLGNPGFEIWLRTQGHDSSKAVLSGRVEATPEGCRIHTRVGLAPLVPAFMMVWLTGVLLGQAVVLLACLAGEEAARQHWFVPGLMALFGAAFYRVSKFMSRPKQRRLRAFADQLWGAEATRDAEFSSEAVEANR